MKKEYQMLIGLVCILIATLSLQCSNENIVSIPPDLSAPSPVTDLTAVYSTITSVTLTWTAPGDDGDRGTASQYDVRYATVPVTEETWVSALQAEGEPSPGAAGGTETFTVRGLEPDIEYFFVVTVADEVHNWSGHSNSEGAKTALYHQGEGTWQVPYDSGTIQEAINAASPGDTVLVGGGTYNEYNIHMKSGIVLLSETGEAGCVILDAGQEGRIMYCKDVDETAVIKGFTFTNGSLELMMNGAGLYCAGSSPQIVNCAFIDNNATGHGGGIQCTFQSSPRIENCIFTNNNVMGHGAGISCMDASSPRIEGCTFTGNATRCHGGAISIITGSAPEVIDCIFSANSAMGEGGAISCTSGASPSISGCRFDNNRTKGMGGAIGCSSDATPAVSYCLFIRNESNHGAAMSFSSSSPVITSCTFADNTANLGSVMLSDESTAVIVNSIIAFNSGSAVHCLSGEAPALSCCDLYGNSDGNWTDCIASQDGLEGNFSANPVFCEEAYPAVPYGLMNGSPCTSANNSSCGLVGALPATCDGSL